MVKHVGKWLIFGLLCALLVAVCLAGTPFSAYAELLTGANAALVLPSSYEQYLALKTPSDVAFSEKHIAIADGKTLYLYDRAARRYSELEMENEHTLTKIGFAGDRLFLSDNSADGNSFYEYNFTSKELQKQSFNCTTFCIDGGKLYTATVSNNQMSVGAHNINDLAGRTEDLGVIYVSKVPSLTVLGNTLYCAVDDRVYYPNPTTAQFGSDSFYLSSDNPNNATQVKSVCAHNGGLYYTAIDGLRISDVNNHTSTLLLGGTGFGALTSYDGALYAVRGTSVHRIDFEGGAHLSDYEIAAASDSEGRLSRATDSVRAGDLLVTADAGNQRISVSVLAEDDAGHCIGTCSILPCRDENDCPYTPEHIATDGCIIAVSSDDARIYLYHFGYEEYFACHDLAGDPAIDLACVNGSCYFITASTCGKAEEDCITFRYTTDSPKALAADANGILYVVNTDGNIYSYTEDEFISPNDTVGTKQDTTLCGDISSLQIDGNRNLYYIRQNALWKNDTQLAEFGNISFVHDDDNSPVAFVWDFEENELFLLYESYIVKVSLGLSNLPA